MENKYNLYWGILSLCGAITVSVDKLKWSLSINGNEYVSEALFSVIGFIVFATVSTHFLDRYFKGLCK